MSETLILVVAAFAVGFAGGAMWVWHKVDEAFREFEGALPPARSAGVWYRLARLVR